MITPFGVNDYMALSTEERYEDCVNIFTNLIARGYSIDGGDYDKYVLAAYKAGLTNISDAELRQLYRVASGGRDWTDMLDYI